MTKIKSSLWAESTHVFTQLFVILSLSIIILTPVTVYSQDNIAPKGWIFGGDRAEYKVALENGISQHGQNSATIESVVDMPSNFSTLMQSIVVKDYSGKRIKMTGFIKSQGTTVSGSMWIRVDDFGNKIFADFDNMMDRPVSGNMDWTKCEIVFDVPEKCMISFGFIFQGNGKIWVDNVSFEIVSNTVNKTAQNMDQPFSEEYLNQLNKYPEGFPEKPPVNLDFEDNITVAAVNTFNTYLSKTGRFTFLSDSRISFSRDAFTFNL